MERETQFHLWYVVAAVISVLLLQYFWTTAQQVEPIPYSAFKTYLHDGKVADITISEHYVYGHFKEALADGRTEFATDRVEPAFADELSKYGVTVSGTQESTVLRDVLSWVLPALFFFAIWMFVFRRFAAGSGLGGGLMAVGKSKAKVYVETDTKVTFDDVAGVDEAIEELREIVTFLQNPKDYGRLGAHIPKGVLLIGPPGTGKTLLARAVAGEAGVPFFSISGSEFVEMFVGVGAARVRDLFDQARQKAPAIIFIDELDALGRARGAFPLSGGHDEKEQTLNQLLSELDGFDTSAGLVLLAATNRPEILDPALLRAGRFDRQVLVDRPDIRGREAIVRVHARKVVLAPDVDLGLVARRTPGMVGADLANVVNEAALASVRRNATAVTMGDFEEAMDRLQLGLKKEGRVMNEDEKRRVAFHEAGHALVALTVPNADPVHRVTIIPRSIGALGATLQLPTDERYVLTREELDDRLCVLLGGRSAEEIACGTISTGAQDDLERATAIAKQMVCRFGMSDALGPLTWGRTDGLQLVQGPETFERDYSEETARAIDAEVRRIVEASHARAAGILRDRCDALDAIARDLLVRETLERAELETLAGPSSERRAVAPAAVA
jgi:cell division protease FtsH